MPVPDVYHEGVVEPFGRNLPISKDFFSKVLYATDRRPTQEGNGERFYADDRGYLLRVGEATIELARPDITWEEARRISLLKNRTDKFALQVHAVEEFGVLADTVTVFAESDTVASVSSEAAARFANVVNQRLAGSADKDIFIYIHGYKVNFENPLLVASELWHFLGYEGVFIAYAWPSTPKRLAYFKDAETARVVSPGWL